MDIADRLAHAMRNLLDQSHADSDVARRRASAVLADYEKARTSSPPARVPSPGISVDLG